MKKAFQKIGSVFSPFNLFNITLRRQINGRRFKIPIIRKIGYDNFFLTELWMLDLLKILLKNEDGGFIDVGANVGQTLLKVKCIQPEIEYFAFEPNPICSFYLQELVKANAFTNTHLIPAGLYTEDRLVELQFLASDPSDSSASVIKGFRPQAKIDHIQVVPLFRFESVERLLQFPKIAMIKIDVEGAELEVLQSLGIILSRDRPKILLEILPVYLAGNNFRIGRQESVEQLIAKFDYSVLRVVNDKKGRFLGLKNISRLGIVDNLDLCNYLLVPVESKEQFNHLIVDRELE
jgi:FkbM family methyltransferase